MPMTIFSLDVRRARKGDCMILHYGSKSNPRLIMIDGGPDSVYKPHLKPRLQQIKQARVATGELEQNDSLPVDMLMISHVDDDHLKGILEMTKEEIVAKDAHKPRLVNVLDFWHNSFNELINHTPDELTAAFSGHFGVAAAGGATMSDELILEVEEESDDDPVIIQSGLSVIASIPQGFQLRRDAKKLGYPLNVEFDGNLILADEDTEAIDFGDGLQLTVIGPMKAELKKLHEDHIKWLKALRDAGKSPPAALAAYVDRSVANLSSIVVLVEVGTKSILLTGDARGDKIIEGMEMLDLFDADGTIKIDVMKGPHHGSDNNVDNDFFERIIADHYVFSGNGEHGNPERGTFEMLFAARGTEPFTVHLTYPIDEIDAAR
ncbi:MAG TPA: hypothetical protein VM939_12950, partial [Gemmatimonadaceae bacterium]|nr:hypothetical protein [Gemmatimonadaceae bacterium]